MGRETSAERLEKLRKEAHRLLDDWIDGKYEIRAEYEKPEFSDAHHTAVVDLGLELSSAMWEARRAYFRK